MNGTSIKTFAAITLLAGTLWAQAGDTVPFTGVCYGQVIASGEVFAKVWGNGSHLGQFTGTVNFKGAGLAVVLVAANGDELTADVTPSPSGGGSAVITGGTGRFKGASGQWVSEWTSWDDTTSQWVETFDGRISTTGYNQRPEKDGRAVSGGGEGVLSFVPNDYNGDGVLDMFDVVTMGNASGHLTHLGAIQLHTDQRPMPDGKVRDGHVTITAANGDELYGDYVGMTLPGETPDQLIGTVTFVISDGTGRFEHATGVIEAIAHVTVGEYSYDSQWPVTWRLEGTISY